MRRIKLKRAVLVIIAFAFSLTPVLRVNAVEGEDENSWSQSGGDKTYCDGGSAKLFTAICAGKKPSFSGTTERYIDITMHVKEGEGHFEEGNPNERTETYFRSDVFNDTTKPVSDRSGYVFAGWSTNPEAEEVDVELGAMTASVVGTDVYAVWSDKAYVYYHIYSGVWTDSEGNDYQHILMEYDAGTKFKPLNPAPHSIEHVYDFVGWNTQVYGRGEKYDETTTINEIITEVYSEWYYNADLIEDEMVLDEVYDVVAGVSVPLYKFTPSETAFYEIYTDGIEDDGTNRQGMIRLQDIHDRNLASEKPIDPTTGWSDVHLYYNMEAGQTYYIRFGEIEGSFIRFNASIRKAETAMVTFDSNHGDDAWFDDDHSRHTKEIEIPVGDDIALRRVSELDYDTTALSFVGWAPESDSDEFHNTLIVTGATTVYAVYGELTAVYLDYNGGYSPFNKAETSYIARFRPSDWFETPIDPKVDDPHLKFVGWSRKSDATKPDEDIVEHNTTASQLEGETLYAVYGDKVSVTFNTTGGAYMLDDPDITSYTSSLGNGHIFYGMQVSHYHPNVVHMGWTDQNGEYIPETSDVYGFYHLDGDTTFTSVLGYKIIAFGNSGYFPQGGGIGRYTVVSTAVPYEGWNTRFSYADVEEILGTPQNDDTTLHFVGYATYPDATEPDIIDGETYLEDLYDIYAIWSDEEPKEEPEGESEEEPEPEVIPKAPDTGIVK